MLLGSDLWFEAPSDEPNLFWVKWLFLAMAIGKTACRDVGP